MSERQRKEKSTRISPTTDDRCLVLFFVVLETVAWYQCQGIHRDIPVIPVDRYLNAYEQNTNRNPFLFLFLPITLLGTIHT